MEIAISTVNRFRNAFKEDFGVELNGDEASDAFERLSKFFDLLDQFDREDQSLLIKANGNKKLL
ncbi:MAG: hypothetical protein NTX52_14225 [Planctomycetota bacterium]|nr:hypothetical protein [Planctomycetota bacterium]